MAGPNAEHYFRQAYAPVDFAIGQAGQYAGYGRSGRSAAVATGAMTGMAAGAGLGAMIGGNTRSALIGAGVGTAAGGLLTYAATRTPRATIANNQYAMADGREVRFATPKPQKPLKPLDCSKPRGKRGKNEAACEAAEAEIAVAERQTCLTNLAASSWRLQNGSDRFTFAVTEDGQPFMVCGEPLVLRPLQTVRIFSPDGQIGGVAYGAAGSGRAKSFTAVVQAVNRPSFIGFVLAVPVPPEEGN